MTSAPRSANNCVQKGPGSNLERSTTRTPWSGCKVSSLSSAQERLELHGERHVALDLDLALHEGRRGVHLARSDGDPVFALGDRDGALGLAVLLLDPRAVGLGEIGEPLAAAFAADVEQVRGVDLLRLLGV